jgi:hypothetical protein
MKKIFVLSFISVGYFLNAQNLSNSPYATYGIGDVKYDNTIETASMGGISTAYISDLPAISILQTLQTTLISNLQVLSWKLPTKTITLKQIIIIRSLPNILRIYLIFLCFPLSPKLKMGFLISRTAQKAMILSTEIRSAGNIRANRFKGSGTLNTAQIALGL